MLAHFTSHKYFDELLQFYCIFNNTCIFTVKCFLIIYSEKLKVPKSPHYYYNIFSVSFVAGRFVIFAHSQID